MKSLNAIVLLFTLALLAGCRSESKSNAPPQTQASDMPGMKMGTTAQSNAAPVYHGRGQVVKVNPAGTESIAGVSLTLDHEDIPDYMSAMRMTFPVADPAQVSQLKAGDKISFDLVQQHGGVYAIQHVELLPADTALKLASP